MGKNEPREKSERKEEAQSNDVQEKIKRTERIRGRRVGRTEDLPCQNVANNENKERRQQQQQQQTRKQQENDSTSTYQQHSSDRERQSNAL